MSKTKAPLAMQQSKLEADKKMVTSRIIEGEKEKVNFSFKYIDLFHKDFSPSRCEDGYLEKFLDRLRDLNGCYLKTVQTARRDDPRRMHKIDWGRVRDADYRKGFQNIPKQFKALADDEAWQFGVTGGKHGRVHGFIPEGVSIFYIVWLDPDHLLFPINIQDKNKRGKR